MNFRLKVIKDLYVEERSSSSYRHHHFWGKLNWSMLSLLMTSEMCRVRALMLRYWWPSASISSDTDVSPQWLMGHLALSFFTGLLVLLKVGRLGGGVGDVLHDGLAGVLLGSGKLLVGIHSKEVPLSESGIT